MSKRFICMIFAFLVSFEISHVGMALAQPVESSSGVMPGRARSLQELLELVKDGRAAEAKENQAREQKFRQDRDAQKQLLADAEKERKTETDRSAALEAEFAANDQRLSDLQRGLDKEVGSMKELFGVLRYAAIDKRQVLERSIISAEFSDRRAALAALTNLEGTPSRLPDIEQIETLWYEYLREMTEAGKIVTFDASVLKPDGGRQTTQVLRVGAGSLSSEGAFLRYDGGTGTIEQLARQPSAEERYAAKTFQDGTAQEIRAFPVDPMGGALLARLVQKPSLSERLAQGGIVGYLIIGLGILAGVLIIERLLFLTNAGTRLRLQMRSDEISTSSSNALGRILTVYEQNKTADVETLEFRLNEAISKEVPIFERSIIFIRVISLAAPLLGLLGTAIGFVQTFQAVSLLGNTGPEIIASGVAQAMIPTVLGLLVAIPALFAHNLIASMSRRIVEILQQQSAGIVAVHAEREHK